MDRIVRILKSRWKKQLLLIVAVIFSVPAISAGAPKPVIVPPIQLGHDGKLIYRPDSLGNRIPDFSYRSSKSCCS